MNDLADIYERGLAVLGPEYQYISAWLIEHHPEIWKTINRRDDEIRSARDAGEDTPFLFMTKVQRLVTLFERAKKQWEQAGSPR